MSPTRNSVEDLLLSYRDEHDAEKEFPIVTRRSAQQYSRFAISLCVLSVSLNAILLAYFVLGTPLHVKSLSLGSDGRVWSPVQGSAPWTNVLFPTFTQGTKYSGPPTDDVDAAWQQLYSRSSVSAIPGGQAMKLKNSTERVPGLGQPRFLVGIDVFHQLHCLDIIRKSRYPDRYPPHEYEHFAPPGAPGDPTFDHLDHCINNIRQSIMCNADITPNVIQWDPQTHRNWARLDVVHTCRDFEKIQDWAKDQKVGVRLNWTEHVGFPEDNA